jgi:8-oxo-dGTP pyrophosphatase MutT (NUDIX family)
MLLEDFDILNLMNAYKTYSVPVSVKGIVFEDGGVWLRKNERNEWELPGGKMDEGEQPEATVARELAEELGFTVAVKRLISAHLATITVSKDENRGVLVLSYACDLLSATGVFEHQGEAGDAEFHCFSIDEVPALNMPQFYKDAIVKCRYN